jgi:hypothetical protein
LGSLHKCEASLFFPISGRKLTTQTSQTAFGVTIAGEWASSPNDCGYFLRGVGPESTNPQCPDYDNYQNYNDTMKAGLLTIQIVRVMALTHCASVGILNYVLATMDATRDWFFWTWKVGKPPWTGTICFQYLSVDRAECSWSDRCAFVVVSARSSRRMDPS